MAFDTFGLHPALMRGLESVGFTEPTPIQSEAIPPVMAGRDLLASAKTGSGKTAAFLLPILNRLLSRPRGATRALVLTPTRELAAQIDEHFAMLAYHTKLTGAAVYGGVSMQPQTRALEAGVDLLVATPGRLLDHMRYPYANLDSIEVLVLDEADRMLDMGFLPDIRRILRALPRERQTLLFSATLPEPIVKLSQDMLRNPLSISIGRPTAPAESVNHTVFSVAAERKAEFCLSLLDNLDIDRALVFTRTRHRADRLARFFERSGVPVGLIHGARTQSQRDQALRGFKQGRFRVLVATDVAARGIDVEELSHVVNFDVPGQPADYIHRVGRTGRADCTGDALTLVSPDEERDMRTIERAIGRPMPRQKIAGFEPRRGELRETGGSASGPPPVRVQRRPGDDARRPVGEDRRPRRADGQPGEEGLRRPRSSGRWHLQAVPDSRTRRRSPRPEGVEGQPAARDDSRPGRQASRASRSSAEAPAERQRRSPRPEGVEGQPAARDDSRPGRQASRASRSSAEAPAERQRRSPRSESSERQPAARDDSRPRRQASRSSRSNSEAPAERQRRSPRSESSERQPAARDDSRPRRQASRSSRSNSEAPAEHQPRRRAEPPREGSDPRPSSQRRRGFGSRKRPSC